jgi:SAM-dependent methyltransferase
MGNKSTHFEKQSFPSDDFAQDSYDDISQDFSDDLSQDAGIDLNQDAKNFLQSDVQFNLCSAMELSSVVKGDADIVFTSNFLEHLPDKKTLDIFLDQVKLALKPEGKYLILGPNLRYLPGQYWDFYDHHLGLSHLSLVEALKLKGFTIDVCVDKFLPFSTQSSLPTHPILVKMYLRVPLVWKILGKQFFIIARKV